MAAGDEQHRDWRDARNEERIMIGAAHHGEKTHAMLSARLSQRIDYFWRGVYRRGRLSQIWVKREPAVVLKHPAHRLHPFPHPVRAPGVPVAAWPPPGETAGGGVCGRREKLG